MKKQIRNNIYIIILSIILLSCNNEHISNNAGEVQISNEYNSLTEKFVNEHQIDSSKTSLVLLFQNHADSNVTYIALYTNNDISETMDEFHVFGVSKFNGIRILYCNIDSKMPLKRIKKEQLPKGFLMDYNTDRILDYPTQFYKQTPDTIIRIK